MPKDIQLVKTEDLDNRLALLLNALNETQSNTTQSSEIATKIQVLLDFHQSYTHEIPKLQAEEEYTEKQVNGATEELKKYEQAPDSETKEAKKERERNKASAARNLKEREKWRKGKNDHRQKLKQEINKLISDIIKIREELALTPFPGLEELLTEPAGTEPEQSGIIAGWRQRFKNRERSVSETQPIAANQALPGEAQAPQAGEIQAVEPAINPTGQSSKPTWKNLFAGWLPSSMSTTPDALSNEVIVTEDKPVQEAQQELSEQIEAHNARVRSLAEAEKAFEERSQAAKNELECEQASLKKEKEALAALAARENTLIAKEINFSLLEKQTEAAQKNWTKTAAELETLRARLYPQPSLENSIKTILNEFTQVIEAKGSTASRKLCKLYCEIKTSSFEQRSPRDKLAFLETWFNKHKPAKRIGFLSWLFRFIGRPCRKPENKLMYLQLERALAQARQQADRENPPTTLTRDSSTDSIASIPGPDAAPLSEEDKKLKQAIDATVHCIHDWFNSFYFVRLDAPPFISMLEAVISGSTKKGRKENWNGKSLQQQAEFLLQASDNKKDQRFFKPSYAHAIHNLALKEQLAAKQEELRRFLPSTRT